MEILFINFFLIKDNLDKNIYLNFFNKKIINCIVQILLDTFGHLKCL